MHISYCLGIIPSKITMILIIIFKTDLCFLIRMEPGIMNIEQPT